MKVHELITALTRLDPNALVHILLSYTEYRYEDGYAEEYDIDIRRPLFKVETREHGVDLRERYEWEEE